MARFQPPSKFLKSKQTKAGKKSVLTLPREFAAMGLKK